MTVGSVNAPGGTTNIHSDVVTVPPSGPISSVTGLKDSSASISVKEHKSINIFLKNFDKRYFINEWNVSAAIFFTY